MTDLQWYERLHWRAFLLFIVLLVLIQIPIWLLVPDLAVATPDRAAWRALGISTFGALLTGVITMVVGRYYLKKRLGSVRRLLDGSVAEQRSLIAGRDEVGVVAEEVIRRHDAMRENILRLRREKGRLSALLEGMGEAVVMLDESEKVLVANPVAERLLRLKKDYVGERLASVCEFKRINSIVSEVLWSGEPASHEVDIPGKREELRHLSVSASPIVTDEDVLGMVLVLTDVTRLRRLERVRRDFVANVSHELRTPIAAIRSSAETLLLADFELDDVMVDFLETIERNSVRMAGIVEDLLTLSRLEAAGEEVELHEVALAPVFADVYDRSLPLARDADVEFAMEVAEDLPSIFVEEGAIRQILQNLVENSIKYTPPGGDVKLVAERKGRKRVRIDVIDTGVGIPPEHLPRVFERFYRVDVGRSREVGGTGLGLAIVKHLVRKMKGRISVESDPGTGTTFTLWFRVFRPEKAS